MRIPIVREAGGVRFAVELQTGDELTHSVVSDEYDAVDAILRDAADRLVAQLRDAAALKARGLAPVDTGALR